jgi:hypothetical protein
MRSGPNTLDATTTTTSMTSTMARARKSYPCTGRADFPGSDPPHRATSTKSSAFRRRSCVVSLFVYSMLWNLSFYYQSNNEIDATRDRKNNLLDLLPEGRSPTKAIQKVDDPSKVKSVLPERPMESLSSCLCVMDDNSRLVEWIAYHYFVMKLRYLVILPDPKSVIWPKHIIEKWRKYMTIVEWKDADYMTEEQYNFSLSVRNMAEPPKKLAQQHHNMRQNHFLKRCALHMKEHNRTWVSFTDVDEYYVINHELITNSTQLMGEPGGGFKVLQEMNKLLESLHQLANLTITDHFVGPCITTYRTLFGAVESKDAEIQRSVPSFLDPRRFETLRWRYHKSPKIKAQDGKSLPRSKVNPRLPVHTHFSSSVQAYITTTWVL